MSGSGLAGFGRSLAFLVGIDRYTNGVPELRTAVADVESVADVLRKEHGFRTKVSTDENATIGRLRWSLKALRRWVRPDDRVLFYFAGHGIAVESDEGPRGYILPQDADRNSIAGCLPMVELDEALSMVRCRHMLVVLDCCFAGAFRWSSFRHLALRPENLHQERYAWFIRDPAWQAIASAAHDQRAIDVVAGEPLGERGDGGEHSPFARALLDGLKGAADRAPAGGTGDGVITATELFLYLQDKLLPPPLRQAPILWPLKNHHRGEFVFLVPGRQLDLPPGPPLDPNANPWRGLQPYERAHADLFFGRSRASERLRARVLAEQFVVVTGPSGIGKSSLVRAGLLPRLPAGIEPLVVRPGPQPFGSLAAVLRDATPQGTSSPDAKVLKADVYALAKWVKARTGGRELLLVLDQAEELITQNREAKATQDFLALFASALDQTDARLRLVITIRSEFEPQFAQSPLSNRWSTARYLVPQMTQDELRRVIEGPAAVKVMRFEEDGLVDQLINEVVNMPGALPLLSFALSEMYAHYLTRQSDDRTLTWSDYNALQGGVTGSLRVRANQVVDSVDEAHRATARRVLERLVSVDAGEFARRRVPKSELDAPDPEENARIDEVIERLDAARLIVTDEADGKDILELAHDALILGWDRLLAWVREDLERIITLRRLSPDARQWAFSLPRRPSLLWSDAARLATIKALRMFASPGLNRVEASFAQASIERAKRNQRLRTAVGAALVLLTIGAGIGAYYSWTQTLVARRQTENAVANETRSLTALSIVASERGNHGDGLTLALAAWPRSALNDVRPRLETTLQAISLALSASQGEISRLEAPGRIHNVWFDEARMTAIGEVGDDTIAVWDLRPGGVPMRKVNIPEKVWSVEVSNDRNRVLTRSDDGSFRLFDRELKQLGSTMKHGDRVSNAMFSPSGTRIVTWSRDGTARLWDAQDGTPIGRPMQHPEAVEAAFFSAAGRYVVTWSNTSLYLWDPATASLIKGPLESGSLARGVLTFDDDRRMLSWSIDKDIKLWDVESGSRLGEGLMHDGPADGAILLDGNTKLLTWSSFSDLRLWDVQTYQQIGNVMTHEYSVDGVTVTEDEKIAFSWSGEYLYVWDLQSAAARCPPMQNDGSVRGAAFSNAQDKILAWTEKGKLRLWDIKACKEAVPEMAHGPMTYGYQSASWEKPKLSLPSNGIVAINGATISRDDHRILSWSEDGTLRAWDTATGHQIGPERRHFGVVGGVALF
ncbi:MAG: caspase family protein, partial [Rhizobiaceae bacterium]